MITSSAGREARWGKANVSTTSFFELNQNYIDFCDFFCLTNIYAVYYVAIYLMTLSLNHNQFWQIVNAISPEQNKFILNKHSWYHW